jgi:hypothetical protein
VDQLTIKHSERRHRPHLLCGAGEERRNCFAEDKSGFSEPEVVDAEAQKTVAFPKRNRRGVNSEDVPTAVNSSAMKLTSDASTASTKKFCTAVSHDILDFSARVLVTDCVELPNGPTGLTISRYVGVLVQRLCTSIAVALSSMPLPCRPLTELHGMLRL